jgi:sarcosine oxidase subunit alpha
MAKMPLTRKLVGFTLDDPSLPCPEECHLVIRAGEIVGRVTSAAQSPDLGKVVGLAYVHPDDAKPDAKIAIKIDGGRMIEARIVALPFYDPESKRQEM